MNVVITKASKHVSLRGESLRSLQICALGIDTGFFMTNDPSGRVLYNYGHVTLYVRPMSGNRDTREASNTLQVEVAKLEGVTNTTAVLTVTQLIYEEMEKEFLSLGTKYESIRIETGLLGEKVKSVDPLEIHQEHEIVNFEFHTRKTA